MQNIYKKMMFERIQPHPFENYAIFVVYIYLLIQKKSGYSILQFIYSMWFYLRTRAHRFVDAQGSISQVKLPEP